jgi:hypothetical protein
MRLAALGKTGELAFQPQTFSIHQPWSFLGHLLKDGAPALRSLDIYNPGFVTKDSRPHDSIATVLHLIATRNSGLERISLGLTDLIDDIVPIISTYTFNASLPLTQSDVTPPNDTKHRESSQIARSVSTIEHHKPPYAL